MSSRHLPNLSISKSLKKCPDNAARAEDITRNVKFRYLNYSDVSDDPLATYGDDNVKQMRDVANKYDPTGVFQTRVPGGFKISKVRLERQSEISRSEVVRGLDLY